MIPKVPAIFIGYLNEGVKERLQLLTPQDQI